MHETHLILRSSWVTHASTHWHMARYSIHHFNHSLNSRVTYWEAVKQIYQYILGTKSLKLMFGSSKKGLEGFTDTDSATQEHRHVISDYMYILMAEQLAGHQRNKNW